MSIIKKYLSRYFITAMSAMAQGLFASLLIGTIFKALGMIPHLGVFSEIGGFAQAVAGPAMAAAIAYSLGCDPLVIFSSAAVGYAANSMGGAGGPLAVFFIAIIAAVLGQLVSKKTKVDIIVTPFVTLLVGGLLSVFAAPFIGKLVGYVSYFIGWAATQAPLVTGLAVSVAMGIALTLPISSAAICAGLVLTGSALAEGSSVGLAIAGGAAVAGCCAQMVGFAVISFKDNGVGGLLSQGVGTSMLQMPNIIKKPIIWLPPIIASAVTGPLATCVFSMRMYGAAINSGMGTCGLLGPVGIILGWLDPANGYPDHVGVTDWLGLALICFILPALISYLVYLPMKKTGLIKDGDMKL